jgi:hypothetical protein
MGDSKVDQVLALLERRMPFPGKRGVSIFRRVDVEALLKLSGDVDTTAEILLLVREANLAKNMAEHAPYEKIATDLIDAAKRQGESPATLVEAEGNRPVVAAEACLTLEKWFQLRRYGSSAQIRLRA